MLGTLAAAGAAAAVPAHAGPVRGEPIEILHQMDALVEAMKEENQKLRDVMEQLDELEANPARRA